MPAVRGRGRGGDVDGSERVVYSPLGRFSPMHRFSCLSPSLRSDSKNIDSAPVHLGTKNVTVRF